MIRQLFDRYLMNKRDIREFQDEIIKINEDLKDLKDLLPSNTPIYSDMPKASGTSNKTCDYAIKIAEEKENVLKRKRVYEKMILDRQLDNRRVDMYIDTEPDEILHITLDKHYRHGMSYDKIADELQDINRNANKDMLVVRVNRFIHKLEEEERERRLKVERES